MSQTPGVLDGFSWTGSLDVLDVRFLYERCQRLRLTGRVTLRDGDRQLVQVWIGGRPLDLDPAAGLEALPLWTAGEFRIEQRVPDLDGQLTEGTELTGPLLPGQVQRLGQLCADLRLSADVHLLGAGAAPEDAHLRFTHGKVDGATVKGRDIPAVLALAQLAGWVSGQFRLSLRPLFGEERPPEAPIFIDKSTTKGDFDVTGAMQIPLDADDPGARVRPARSSRPSRPSRPGQPGDRRSRPPVSAVKVVLLPDPPPVLTEVSGERQVSAPFLDVSPEPDPPGSAESPRPVAAPSQVSPSRSPSAVSPVVAAPVASVLAPADLPDVSGRVTAPRSPGSTLLWSLCGAAIAAIVVGSLVWWLWSQHDADEEPPRRRPTAQTQPAGPSTARPAPAPAADPPEPAAATEPPAADAPGPATAAATERSPQVQALVQRARRLIVDGRGRKAADLLEQAREQAPADAALLRLLRQARGELGKGELWLTRPVMLNGQRLGPRRLRLPAGDYLVDGAEVELKDGARLELP